MTRRVRSLTQVIKNIWDGNYAQRVSLRGRDEIGQLGGAFNDMAENLERSAREIFAKEYTNSILNSAVDGICGADAHNRITFATPLPVVSPASASRSSWSRTPQPLGRGPADLWVVAY